VRWWLHFVPSLVPPPFLPSPERKSAIGHTRRSPIVSPHGRLLPLPSLHNRAGPKLCAGPNIRRCGGLETMALGNAHSILSVRHTTLSSKYLPPGRCHPSPGRLSGSPVRPKLFSTFPWKCPVGKLPPPQRYQGVLSDRSCQVAISRGRGIGVLAFGNFRSQESAASGQTRRLGRYHGRPW